MDFITYFFSRENFGQNFDVIKDNKAYKKPKGQNYIEKWHISRRWKHGCKVCEECDHHSHLYCKRCKKVVEGIYKRCECPRVHSHNLWSKNLCNYDRSSMELFSKII